MGLKSRLVYWQLGRLEKSRKRTRKFINLNHAQSVGIIWSENDRAAFEMLKKYLDERKIKSIDLCYSDEDRAITFSNKDFSYMAKTKNQAVNDFINERFDLLFDISLSDSLAVQIVRALSLASFKTGWSLATPNYFDFSIDISQRRDAYFLAEQLIHYLNEIK
ncbi:DUF6913 domain-containing protein [Mangrovibacterium lignilyticum]|uniref:DUF6913 domain-containing protein n=1 Tax=Mangrovibacterium lignilyticum TaxID=2668052 RepID=UPI0013D0E1DD|nr:hypothetical protein [Mangrovibacterium lignilyticum]